jgi:hypothetical protein
MPVHLIQALCQQENIPMLPKIDPNTQDAPEGSDHLMQAVIPSVLAGFYKLTRSEQNALMICEEDFSVDWTSVLFGVQQKTLIEAIAAYSGNSEEVVADKIKEICGKCVILLCGNAQQKISTASIKDIFTQQRSDILQHLPAAIDIGKIVDDTTLDDRTNKMDGPLSGVMHSIEKMFSSTPSDKEK